MPRLRAKNLAETTLADQLLAGATSCTVVDGTKLPDVPFRISIDDEIIEVGAKNGNTLSSLTRGCEGTTDATHSAGAKVEARWTAGMYDELISQDELASHDVSSGVHGVGSAYIAKSSRSDQLPSWDDIPDKPSTFTPSVHGNEAHDPDLVEGPISATDGNLAVFDGTTGKKIKDGGARTFDNLSDTPASKSGAAGKYPRVNSAATALVYDGAVDMETASRTIYVDSQNGSDTTGDGSSGNPYQTVSKAISTVRNAIADGVTITIRLVGRGSTYPYTIPSFGRLCIGSGNIVIKGEHSTQVSGTATDGTATTITDTTKSWTTDQWAGKLVKFTKSGTDYWRLILSNTADTLTVIGRLEVTPASGDSYVICDWNTFLAGNVVANLTQGTIALQDCACVTLAVHSWIQLYYNASVSCTRLWIRAAAENVSPLNVLGIGNKLTLAACLLDGQGYTYYGVTSSTSVASYVIIQQSWIKSWGWFALWVGGSGSYIHITRGTILEGGSNAVLMVDRNCYAMLYSRSINGAIDQITIKNGTTYGLRVQANAGCVYSGTTYVNYSGNDTDRSAATATYSWYSDAA